MSNDVVIKFLKNKTEELPKDSEEWEIYRIALRAMRVVDAVENQKRIMDMDDGK